MTILLVAVNAKYIHTCPAVYSLRAYAQAKLTDLAGHVRICAAEYTINDRYQDILSGILSHHADVIGFSAYIWNTDRVRRLLRDIRKIRGDEVQLWAGGPEATWYPEDYLWNAGADLCMIGEGEIVFTELVRRLAAMTYDRYSMNEYKDVTAHDPVGTEEHQEHPRGAPDQQPGVSAGHQQGVSSDRRPEVSGNHYPDDNAKDIQGVAYLRDDELIHTGMAPPADLDQIPFLYRDLSLFDNRIIYYEASRGCPFGCAYCLSGRERGIRQRNIETVEEELQFFLDQKVKQVKFIDRTFNADPVFSMRIWKYIMEHDNGVTNFHFEIEADRMTQEQLALAADLRPGLIQMEIGVQSANPQTLRSVHRSPGLDRIRDAVKVLGEKQNINLHLDLIAGLPFEGMESFRRSFQAVYEMRPHQLQLGFLKLLKGTELYERREEYGLVCSEDAPYEVLKTKWLSYEELEILHRVSDRVEEYVNSQGFRRSLPLIEPMFRDAFALFEALAEYYRLNGYDRNRPSVQKRYEILHDFVMKQAGNAANFCGTGRDQTENAADVSGTGRKQSDGHSEALCMSREDLRRITEMIRFDEALHTHPSRRMQTEEIFDFGNGPVTFRFDHRTCSPVNLEAATEFAAG